MTDSTTLASDQESSLIFSVYSKLILNKVRVTTAFLFLKPEKEDLRDLNIDPDPNFNLKKVVGGSTGK